MRASFTWLSKAWRALSRLRLGVILLACALGMIVAGTLLPQVPQEGDVQAWWEAVRERYGALYGPLRALGLFDLFGTPWFQGLLGLLLLSTLACFLNRWRPIFRAVFRPRVRLPDRRFEQAAPRASLSFPAVESAQSALEAALRRRRYRVQVERDGERLYLRADRHRLPRLGTLLTHIGLMCLLLGAAVGGLWGWRAPALVVQSGAVTAVGHDTGVALRCERFEIMRYADGTPRNYRADLTLLAEDGERLLQDTVQVNHPLRYRGVRYYLQSYRLSGTEACDVTLSAARDPGYGLVIAAGLCLLIGMTLTFHFPHRRIWARLGPAGQVALIGSTAWDKERFSRGFEALVAELRKGQEAT